MKKFLCKKGNLQLTVLLSLGELQVMENNIKRGKFDDTIEGLRFSDLITNSVITLKAEQAEQVVGEGGDARLDPVPGVAPLMEQAWEIPVQDGDENEDLDFDEMD